MRDNEDSEAILASIDAKLDRMRERSLAGQQNDAGGAPQADTHESGDGA